jgi:hypothetical protein
MNAGGVLAGFVTIYTVAMAVVTFLIHTAHSPLTAMPETSSAVAAASF